MRHDYDAMESSLRGDETPDNVTTISESAYDHYDEQYTNSRKIRRLEDEADKQHQLWADDLLDYFMLQENPVDSLPTAPQPTPNIDLNRPIDEKGYTALHWASAMGDVEVVRDLLKRGASIEMQSKNGRTPLMRAVEFTNSFDHQNMERLAAVLIRTVNMQDWFGSTVFHHISDTTQRKSKYQCARYYMDCLLNKMTEILSPGEITRILDTVDQNGDTSITIAARHGARKCVRSLIGRNAAVDIPNNAGETADQLIVQLNHRRQERASNNRQLSSSPFQADNGNHAVGGAVQPPTSANGIGIPFDPLLSHQNGNTAAVNGHDVYKSEAALAVTSQIMPVLFNKAKTLASSIDAEIQEKDAEVAECERVAAMRRAEIEVLKKQAEELRAKDMQSMKEGETDEGLAAELEVLEKECQNLTEQEANLALKKLLDEEKAKAQQQQPSPNPSDTNPTREEDLLSTQHTLATQLLTLKQNRYDLINEVVKSLSVAGGDDGKRVNYQRLISGALAIKEGDIEGMLPDIVAELEEWRGLESVGA